MSDNYQKLKEYRQGLQGKNEQAKPAALPQADQAEAVPDAYKGISQNPDEPTTSDKVKGYLGGAVVEMGGGIGGTLGYMKWLNKAKWASRAAKTNPAFWSNPWGWAAMAGGEATIWGVSNLAGQEVRKAYGLQKEGTRVSEVYASAFFGLTPVTKLVEGRKIFEFAQPVVGEAFKSKLFRIGANGTKTVISGASLGLLESAFRQEIAIIMGEQKNGRIYEDYVASSAAGGGVNLGLRGVGSLWHMWRNSGAWGRGQAAEAVGRIQQNLEAKEANLVNKIEEAKTPSKATNPWVTAYGGAYNAGRAAGIREMEKKLIAVRQAKAMNQQAIDEVTEANDAMTKAEKEAVNKPEEAPYTEDDLEVPPPSDKDVVEEPEVTAPIGLTQTKVTDAENKPQVMYHGSVADFETFDESKIAVSDPDAPFNGFWFTSAKQEASPAFRNPRFIKAYYLDIKNPAPPQVYRDLSREYDGTALRNKLKELGYDGVKWGGTELIPTKDPNKFLVKEANMLESEIGSKILVKEKFSQTDLEGNVKTQDSWELYEATPEALRNKGEEGRSYITGGFDDPDDFIQTLGKGETWVAFDKGQIQKASSKNFIDETTFGINKNPKAEEPQAKTEEPKAPEQPTDLPEHEVTFNKLKERLENITLKDNAATEGPAVGVEANALKIERETKLGAAIHHVFVNKNADTGQVQNALDLVQFIRKLNTEVLDKIKVPAGRMVQSQRLDAAQFKFNERTSARAREEDFRLSELEKAIKERLDGNEDVELDKMHKRYLDVVPEAKAEGKEIGKRVRKEFEKEQDISVQDPKKVAKQQAKTKVKLQKRLAQLQKRFGDDSKLKPKDAAKKELADAEIEDLKERIKFYELNEKDALRLVDRLKERDRLLKIETGPLSGQRAETNKPSLKAKRTPGDLEKVDAEIAFLKKNMRNRVREIDRAQEELSPEFQAEQIAKAHDKAITRLDKELEQLQKEFGDMDAVEQQAALDASKPKPEPNPDIKDRQERIKFHKDARKEALKIAQLEKQLAETVEMEARGVMSEMRAATDPKPKGPKQPLKSEMIRKQISESKARMRKKVADIDKARVKMDEEASNLRVLKAVEKHLYETMLNETGDKAVDYARQALALRQLAMISQPASATAGLGTGIAGTFKQLTRPFATLVHDVFNKNTRPLAFKNFEAEVRGLAIMFKDWEGTATAMKRTFKNMESATGGTGGRNRLTDEKQFGRRADYRSFQKVKANVERQLQAKRNLKTYLSKTPTGRVIWTAYELGVKSIMALDEIPRRQFLKGQQASEAIQDGHKAFPDDPEKAFEHAQELLNTRWKDDDGLRVLSAVGEQQNSTAYVNRELLFAGNATDIDESEFAETLADSLLNKLWRPLTNLKNHPVISLGARFVSPFMTVALRSGGRLARVGTPIIPLANATNLPVVGNPYNRKLKAVEQELEIANVRLREGSQNPKDIDTEQKYIDALNEKKERIETRRILHNRDILADQMLGATFYSTGFLGAVAGGYVVGSQAWMTEDQRNTYGAKEFTMFGWSYKEWIPISLAMSLGADIGAWMKIKDIERKNKVKILNDDQDLLSVLKSSAKQLIKDLPFNQSIKDMEGLANDSANVATTVAAKYLGSILPNPALVKKLTKYFQAGGRVADLKGMDFWDRTVYEALGDGVKNWKTDDFGEDIETEMSGGQIVWRSIPDREKKETEWDYNKKLDYYNDIPKPKTMFKGLRMTDFKRDDGVHLQYAFNLELRKTNVKKSVFKIINNPSWKKLRDSGSVDIKGDGTRSNPALSEIGAVLNDFNDQVVDRLLSRRDYLQTFVSTEKNEKGTPAYKKYGENVTLKQRLDAMERVEGRPDNFKPRPIEDLLKLTNQ